LEDSGVLVDKFGTAWIVNRELLPIQCWSRPSA
jgi:hypothetical protein